MNLSSSILTMYDGGSIPYPCPGSETPNLANSQHRGVEENMMGHRPSLFFPLPHTPLGF